jgi:hypothetical protein
MLWAWVGEHWESLSSVLISTVALLFSAYIYRKDTKVKSAMATFEITKFHRDYWTGYYDRPGLARLRDRSRDLAAHPLADEEVRFANFLFLHIRTSYVFEQAGIYDRPERLKEDIQETFSPPAVRAAWEQMKRLHDSDFVAFIEGFLS